MKKVVNMVDYLLSKPDEEYDFHKINWLMRKELKQAGVIVTRKNGEYKYEYPGEKIRYFFVVLGITMAILSVYGAYLLIFGR